MEPFPCPAAESGVTLDPLVGSWQIAQLKRGHRFSTDDLLCAWAGLSARPRARKVLDLGAGTGSVGLVVLWNLAPSARLVMVEAQAISHALAQRTVALNHLRDRVGLRLGDLRDPSVVPEGGAYDLVTCSPPYLPLGRGPLSPHPQRAAARFELRGDIFDYLQAARRALAPGGRVAVVFAHGDARLEEATERAGLRSTRRLRVRLSPRRGHALVVSILRHRGGSEGAGSAEEPVVHPQGDRYGVPRWDPPWGGEIGVRDEQGNRTPQMETILAELDPPLDPRSGPAGPGSEPGSAPGGEEAVGLAQPLPHRAEELP